VHAQELTTDIKGFVAPKHGYLEKWARQGVLMLNATYAHHQRKYNGGGGELITPLRYIG
jgi:uracil-DNA glycosylase